MCILHEEKVRLLSHRNTVTEDVEAKRMSMFTICTAIVPEGELEKQLTGLCEAEKRFTREIGVIQRDFYQCIQQPHIIWSNTKWTTEKAHNDAAQSLMRVRKDDRIAAAYFQPGLYFEIFCKEIEEIAYKSSNEKPSQMVVICHGLVATKKLDEWNKTVRELFKDAHSAEGLGFCRTFYNYYNPAEFVGFMGWNSQEDYQKHRIINDLTIEEHCYTGLKSGSSMLAGFNQFYCKPLKVK
jgi:hypothetical protein